MAPFLQTTTQLKGGRPERGLHELQAYLILFRSDSLTVATGISRKGSLGSSSRTSKIWAGQAARQSPQPSHRSVSMLIIYSPEPSLYPKLAIMIKTSVQGIGFTVQGKGQGRILSKVLALDHKPCTLHPLFIFFCHCLGKQGRPDRTGDLGIVFGC